MMTSLLKQGYDTRDKSQSTHFAEKWRDIPGYEGIYQASNEGRIRTCEGKTTYTKRHGVRQWKQRILTPKSPKANGYRKDLRVSLWKNGKRKDYLIARLVAMTWVDGYVEGLTVNHIDGNYLNNRVDNLEWLSIGDNIREGFKTGLYKKSQISIRLVDENDFYIDFASLAEASRYLSRSNGYLSKRIQDSKMTATSLDGEVFRVKVGGTV